MLRNQTLLPALSILCVFINLLLVLLILMPGHYKLSRVADPTGAPILENAVPAGTFENNTESAIPADASYSVKRWQLVNTRIEDNYKIETYEEFKIYKNDRDQTVSSAPLSRYQYLRYWLNE